MTDTVLDIKMRIAAMPLMGGVCFVCEKPFKKRKSIGGVSILLESFKKRKSPIIHHLWYDPKKKKYSDYESQLAYHIALEKEVRANPKQFMLLCNKHHQSLHRLKRFNPDNLDRLISAVRMTR